MRDVPGRPGWRLALAADAEQAGVLAAGAVARALRGRLVRRPRALLALSGGSSPVPMLQALAVAPRVRWPRIDVLQVDERCVPSGDPDRNLAMLRRELLDHVPASAHPLQVEHEDGPDGGAAASAEELAALLSGDAPLDVLHLGLGADGHTASLFPGAPELDERDRLVVATAEAHAGHRRLTLTWPVLDRARRVVLLAPGADKTEALRGVLAGDPDLPASRLAADRVLVVTDHDPLGR